MSSDVKLYFITIKTFENECNMDAKLVFNNEFGMEKSDFFPHNQWVSTEEDCTNPSSISNSYLILGTKGIHRFEIKFNDQNKPTIKHVIYEQDFKMF